MADTQPTQVAPKAPADSPTEETPAPRFSFLATLPERLAADEYVRYVACEADKARERADRDERRMTAALFDAAKLESERNIIAAELRGVRSGRSIDWPVLYAIVAMGVFGLYMIVTAIVGVWS